MKIYYLNRKNTHKFIDRHLEGKMAKGWEKHMWKAEEAKMFTPEKFQKEFNRGTISDLGYILIDDRISYGDKYRELKESLLKSIYGLLDMTGNIFFKNYENLTFPIMDCQIEFRSVGPDQYLYDTDDTQHNIEKLYDMGILTFEHLLALEEDITWVATH